MKFEEGFESFVIEYFVGTSMELAVERHRIDDFSTVHRRVVRLLAEFAVVMFDVVLVLLLEIVCSRAFESFRPEEEGFLKAQPRTFQE